jgi:hypothetical protein
MKQQVMKKMLLFISIAWVMSCFPAFSQEVYRWVDEKGTVHFADDLTRVPEKYRNQARKKGPSKEPESSAPADSKETDDKTEPQSSPVKKDLMGRGEEWWRAKAKEWNDKLQIAQRNYDEAYQALKDKEQEREDSKFKPHSQRKRLTGEKKDFEEKLKEREKVLEEVKNIVEKVLPRQAEEYLADPEWLRPVEPTQKEIPAPEGAPDSKK